ncbi:MAG: cardiolipin synthase [Pseudooceanicola sp.]|nr:cardiolipin synthase [Pseudooceanicola sp.]
MIPSWSVFAGAAAVLIIGWCVYRAIIRAKTPQGAVGWVVFLIAAPWVAVPAFLLIGRNRFRRNADKRQVSRIAAESMAGDAPGLCRAAAWHPRLHAFERLSGLPVTVGNEVDLLVDGEATFDAIMAALDGAERYICLQFYEIADDTLGTALAGRLIAAARRGVEVRVLYDSVGSYALGRAYLERLEVAGVKVAAPSLAIWPPWRMQINFRNHRKVVVIDGQTGFLGGHNAADDYLGKGKLFDHWRDTHLRLRGPVVAQLQRGFAEDWHWATGEALNGLMVWNPEPLARDVAALVASMGPADELDSGALFFVLAAALAQKRLWLASPYFVPDADVSSALTAAALRGVDVRLIVPDRSDHRLPWLAAFSYFDVLRRAGARVWRYKEGFMHQKVVLIDDDVACVGTANLDNRSFRLNFESMAVVHDEGFAGEVAAMLEADLARSVPLERTLRQQRLAIRFGAPLARLFAPIL